MFTALIVIFLFLGYAVGRISHIIAHGKHIQSIHHWVHGIVIALIGILLFVSYLKFIFISFGVGLVISDLGDLIKLRFYGVKEFEKQKFWGI